MARTGTTLQLLLLLVWWWEKKIGSTHRSLTQSVQGIESWGHKRPVTCAGACFVISWVWELLNIFSLIIFTVDNKHLFTPNNEIHRYSTRNNSNLHLPTINLSKFYKGPYISGTKAFNHLPQYLKLWSMMLNVLKYLSRDFYIIIPFTQLRSIMNTMRIKTCKSYYLGCELDLYYDMQILKTVFNHNLYKLLLQHHIFQPNNRY